MPFNQLKKVEGLSKDRVDNIIPGLVIVTTLFKQTRASRIIISGYGIRDGLYFETLFSAKHILNNVLEHSVNNLLCLHPYASMAHVHHVNRLVLKLYDDLRGKDPENARPRIFLYVSSLLYRVGISINFYNYDKHTFYIMAHSRIDGLSHREIIMCALVASYKNKNQAQQMAAKYKDIMTDSDLEMVVQLGTLLQLAVALDKSESQAINKVEAKVVKKQCCLTLQIKHDPSLERKEVSALSSEFAKIWKLQLRIMD